MYGSRFLGGPHRVLLFWHYVGNRVLTTLSNIFTNLNLSDMWTCYKVFRARGAAGHHAVSRTASASRPRSRPRSPARRWRIYEVPISYHGRTYAEGKKITWKDGIRGVWCTVRYGLFR